MLALYLRHGLASGTSMAAIAAAASVVPAAGAITARLMNAWTLVLEVDGLRPEAAYTITFSANDAVLDGVGQSLQGSSIGFTTERLYTSSVVDATDMQPNWWPVQSSDSFGVDRHMDWPVYRQLTSAALPAATFYLLTTTAAAEDFLTSIMPTAAAAAVVDSGTAMDVVSAAADVDKRILSATNSNGAFGASAAAGLLVRRTAPQSEASVQWTDVYVGHPDIALSVHVAGNRTSAWVLNVSRATPMPMSGVEVLFFNLQNDPRPWVATPWTALIAGNNPTTTDTNGYAVVRSWRQIYARRVGVLASIGGVPVAFTTVFTAGSAVPDTELRVVLSADRGLYRIGENVTLHGFVRAVDPNGTISIPPGALIVVEANWWAPSSGRSPATYVADAVLDKRGVFEQMITVPADADFGRRDVSVALNWAATNTVSIVVADPRVPIATLNCTATQSIVAVSALDQRPPEVECTVATYSASPIAGASISIACVGSLSSAPQLPLSFEPTGILTDLRGIAAGNITVPTALVPQHATDSASISCTATSLAPTRDTMSATFSFSLQPARITASIVVPTTRLIPGVETTIAIRADVRGNGWQPARLVSAVLLELLAADSAPSFPCSSRGVGADGIQWLDCAVSLPRPGRFTLQVTLADKENNFAAADALVGLTEDEWRAAPLARLPDITVSLSHTDAQEGAVVSLLFDSRGFPRPFAALVLCGSDEPISFVANGTTATASVPLPSRCVRPEVAAVDVLLQTATRPEMDVGIPSRFPFVSATAQLGLPQVTWTSLPLRVASRDVLLTAITMKEENGSARTLRVTASGSDGSAVDGEVIIYVVDRAIIDLAPPEPLDASALTKTSTAIAVQQVGAVSNQLSGNVTGSLARRLESLLSRDPWMPLSSFDRDVANETAVLLARRSEITDFPTMLWELFAAGGDVVSLASGSGAAAPSSSSEAPPLRFVAAEKPATLAVVRVPLLQGASEYTIDVGRYSGAWTARAIVVSSSASQGIGVAEMSFEVRRPVSLAPSTPRFARNRDVFAAGVVISVADPPADAVVANVTLVHHCDALMLTGAAMRTVIVVENSPIEVLFSFAALAVAPNCVLRFVATNSGGQELDARDVTLPVLEQLPSRVSGSTFAVTGGVAATEGLVLPLAANGTGSVDVFTAGGFISTVTALVIGAVQTLDRQAPMGSSASLDYAETLLALKLYWNGTELPCGAPFFDWAVDALVRNTAPGAGLREFQSMTPSDWVDIELNARAIGLQRQLAAAGASCAADLETSASTWKLALAGALTRFSGASLVQPQSAESTLRLFAMLGSDYVLPSTVPSFPSLLANVSGMGLESQARMAGLLAREANVCWGAEREATARRLTTTLLNGVRIAGRVAYTADGTSAVPLSMDCQCAALTAVSLFALRGDAAAAVLRSRLALYVASGPDASWPFASWYGPRAAALSDYDSKLSMTTTPSLRVSILKNDTSGLTPLYTVPFLSLTDLRRVDHRTMAFEEFAAVGAVPSIGAAAAGAGEAVITVTMTYAPLPPAVPTTVYQGILVQKTLQRVLANSTFALVNNSDQTFSPGDLLRISIVATVVDALSGVVVEDMLSAGLEGVDTNLAADTEPLTGSQQGSMSGWGQLSWWLAGFDAPQVKADRVMCRALYLPPGSYSCSYYARAVTSGSFTMPGAEAYVTSQPELRGASPHSTVVVAPR